MCSVEHQERRGGRKREEEKEEERGRLAGLVRGRKDRTERAVERGCQDQGNGRVQSTKVVDK